MTTSNSTSSQNPVNSLITAQTISDILHGKPSAEGYKARCPAHDDQHASLSIGTGDDGKLLLKCHAGCEYVDIKHALKDKYNLNLNGNGGSTGTKQIIATYNYESASGKTSYQVVRLEPKSFFQRRPDGRGGWFNNLDDITPIPYRLPELQRATEAGETIYIVEGEKDVDNVRNKLNLAATCNHGGAGKWRDIHSQHLKNANVVIIPDNDNPDKHKGKLPGEEHAQQVLSSVRRYVKRARIVHIPKIYKDISDWIVSASPETVKANLLRLVSEADRPTDYTLAQLRELPPQTWLIPGELPTRSIGVIYAPPNIGKTFIALNRYALPVAQTGLVVIVSGEGLRGLVDRTDAYIGFNHLANEGHLRFRHAVNLFDDQEVDQLISEYRESHETPVRLIVFDTLAMCSTGADENSARDMGVITHNARRIVDELGATVLLIHHTGKNGATERGSSRLRSDCDVMMEIEDRDPSLMLTCNKMRDSNRFEPINLQLIDYQIDETRSSKVVVSASQVDNTRSAKLSDTQRKILEVMALETFRDAGGKASVVMATAAVSHAQLFRGLSALKRKGLIRQAQEGDPYFITQYGLQELDRSHGVSRESHETNETTGHISFGNESHGVSHPFRGETPETTKNSPKTDIDPTSAPTEENRQLKLVSKDAKLIEESHRGVRLHSGMTFPDIVGRMNPDEIKQYAGQLETSTPTKHLVECYEILGESGNLFRDSLPTDLARRLKVMKSEQIR